MPHIEVNGVPLFVDQIGKGPAVVLLHGFASEGRSLRSLVWELDRHFTTISVDLVGHSRSGSPLALDHYELAQIACDLVEVLRASGFQRAAWFGHGLGGRIALEVALRFPDAVAALVLEGTQPGVRDPGERAARRVEREALADRIEADGIPAFVEFWESLPLWESLRARLTAPQLEGLQKERYSHTARGLAKVMRLAGVGGDEWVGDRLFEVTVPVLLTSGRLDLEAVASAEWMATQLPDATVRILDGAGHAAHLEEPEEFGAVVRTFLLGAHRES